MQLIAAITLAEPLLQIAFLLLGRDLDVFRAALLLPLALGVLQLVVGWLIAARPRLARPATAALAIAAIGTAAWTVLQMRAQLSAAQADLMDMVLARSPRLVEILETIARTCLWPLVVLVAVWRSAAPTPADLHRRAEAGGLLVAYGTMMVVVSGLHVAGGFLAFGDAPGSFLAGFLAPELLDVALAVLAIRAGRELVMATQQGRSRFGVLLRIAVIGYPLVIGTAFVLLLGMRDSVPGVTLLVIAALAVVTKLAPLLILRAHTGPLARHAVEVGAPDVEAAIGSLAWVMLWLCALLVGTLPMLFEGRIDGESLVVSAIMIAYVLAGATAFAMARRGPPKRRMWGAIVPAGLAFVVLVLGVVFGMSRGEFLSSQQPFNLIVAAFAVPWTLARFARPSLHGQRGLGSVFE